MISAFNPYAISCRQICVRLWQRQRHSLIKDVPLYRFCSFFNIVQMPLTRPAPLHPLHPSQENACTKKISRFTACGKWQVTPPLVSGKQNWGPSTKSGKVFLGALSWLVFNAMVILFLPKICFI